MSEDLTAGIVRILTPDGGSAGTGFVVTDDGLIATCAHVVEACGAGPGERARLAFRAEEAPVETKVLTDGWSPDQDGVFLRLTTPLPDGILSTGTKFHLSLADWLTNLIFNRRCRSCGADADIRR